MLALKKLFQLGGNSRPKFSKNKTNKRKGIASIATFTTCAPYIEKTVDENKRVKGKCLSMDPKTKKCNKRNNVKTLRSVHKQSCLTPDALKLLVNAWNAEFPEQQINYVEPLSSVWEQLRAHIIKHIPLESGEHAWLEQPWVHKALTAEKAEKIKETLYRPEAPDEWKADPHFWLSNDEINGALRQYEIKYPAFKYYGAMPIDFDLKTVTGSCMINSLCQINLAELLKKRNPAADFIGMVFNLDKHYQQGSHWVSLFVNIPKCEINYWDSFGMEPPEEVVTLIKKLKEQGNKLKIKFKVQINKREHQLNETECGVYSINFIVEQLEGKSFRAVCNTIIRDEAMNSRRQLYFSRND